MCTLTFIPSSSEKVYFSVNRDESPLRAPAVFPKIYNSRDGKVLFPQDPAGGGTWVAVHEKGSVGCLMNGAFEKHKRELPYRKSRGLVLLDFLKFDSPESFRKNYQLEGIEPFTIVLYDVSGKLFDCRWDSQTFHINEKNPTTQHIWSSAPLYNKQQTAVREKWFKDWFNNNERFSQDLIADFHLNAGAEDLFNSVCMNRFGIVASVSFTSIVLTPKNAQMHYLDLIDKESADAVIGFNT